MTARSLYFEGPREVSVRERPIPDPGPGEVRVRTERSAVSPGTELLVYRDEMPDVQADATIDAIDGPLSYPLRYGYSAVGRVTATGRDVADEWDGRRVFAFNPHESHFLAEPSNLLPVELAPETAVFVANMEAAVGFVMDAQPSVGERVVVFGQGPVGLLTTALLAEFPLETLVTVDCYADRRALSRAFGADAALAPDDDVGDVVTDGGAVDGADLTVELSGDPTALDDGIGVTGYAGRVLVGSWYGSKDAVLDLGGEYHRSHIRIRSSQVSRIDPDHAGRWDTDRRLELARDRLRETDTDALVTHRFHVDRADEAYRLLDERKDEAVQVVLTYD